MALRELAIWFAEKPAPPADVFGPLAAFVLDLGLAAKESPNPNPHPYPNANPNPNPSPSPNPNPNPNQESHGEEEKEKELARKERLRDTFSRGAQQRRDFMQARYLVITPMATPCRCARLGLRLWLRLRIRPRRIRIRIRLRLGLWLGAGAGFGACLARNMHPTNSYPSRPSSCTHFPLPPPGARCLHGRSEPQQQA